MRDKINLLFSDLTKMSQTPMILLVSLYLAIDHTCVPCDDVGGSKQLRNAGHSLRLHMHMLNTLVSSLSAARSYSRLTFLTRVAIHVRL